MSLRPTKCSIRSSQMQSNEKSQTATILLQEQEPTQEEEEPIEEEPDEEEPVEEEPEEELYEEEEYEEEGEGEEEEEMEEGEEGEEETMGSVEPIREKRKQKEFEVFVGGLHRDATEIDVKRAFEQVGEVVQVRLSKLPYSHQNKGFGFVRFATVDQAARAANELKHTVVKGKSCGVIRSNDNETLHVRNICTSWTKDDLVEKLKAFELDNLEDVHLVADQYNEGHNRGFAFLDFSTHMDAAAAWSKLRKGEVFFGTDLMAEISFSKTAQPDVEIMAQVKSVFVDGLPPSWDEDKVLELFSEFGEIESIKLACRMPTARRKDFGFVNFATREAALNCIEKVNKDGLGEEDDKVSVKVTLKIPWQRQTPQNLRGRGGHIGKSLGRSVKQPYSFADSFQGRPFRSHDIRFNERPKAPLRGRGAGSRGVILSPAGRYVARYQRGAMPTPARKYDAQNQRGAMPTPARKYDAQNQRAPVRERLGTTVIRKRLRDSYGESNLSNQSVPRKHHYYSTTYARSSEPYYDVDDGFNSRFEHHKSYEYDDIPEYDNSYNEPDHNMQAAGSLPRRRKSRLNFHIDADLQEEDVAFGKYDDYNSKISRDEHLGNERVEYVGRNHGRGIPSDEQLGYERVEYAGRKYRRGLPADEQLGYERVEFARREHKRESPQLPDEHLGYERVPQLPDEHLGYERVEYVGGYRRGRGRKYY